MLGRAVWRYAGYVITSLVFVSVRLRAYVRGALLPLALIIGPMVAPSRAAVVDGQGLGDLQEPDQLEPVQALGAGLVAVDLRQPRIHRRVRADEAVWAKRKYPRTACIIVTTDESISPRSPRPRMYGRDDARTELRARRPNAGGDGWWGAVEYGRGLTDEAPNGAG
jgi:hypothetical protein